MRNRLHAVSRLLPASASYCRLALHARHRAAIAASLLPPHIGGQLSVAHGDQPRTTFVREVAVPPLDQHAEAIAESREVHDVEEEPEPPREASRHLQATKIRNRAMSADRRQVALVAIDETVVARRCSSVRRMLCAACAPICIAAGATPGTARPPVVIVAMSPMTNTSG